MAKSESKEIRINIRVEEELKHSLSSICETTGYSETKVVKECIKAAIRHYERYNHLIFPVDLYPAKINQTINYLEQVRSELKERKNPDTSLEDIPERELVDSFNSTEESALRNDPDWDQPGSWEHAIHRFFKVRELYYNAPSHAEEKYFMRLLEDIEDLRGEGIYKMAHSVDTDSQQPSHKESFQFFCMLNRLKEEVQGKIGEIIT